MLQKYINLKQIENSKMKIKDYIPCLGNISKDFTIINTTKNRLKEVVNFFSVDFKPIDFNDILDTINI